VTRWSGCRTRCAATGPRPVAAQDALTRVYLRWGRLDEPLSYARRCVVNATTDQWRHLSRRQRRERTAAAEPTAVLSR
jgi:DNA-directed RNA polymerase specialized sigma24 family protein